MGCIHTKPSTADDDDDEIRRDKKTVSRRLLDHEAPLPMEAVSSNSLTREEESSVSGGGGGGGDVNIDSSGSSRRLVIDRNGSSSSTGGSGLKIGGLPVVVESALKSKVKREGLFNGSGPLTDLIPKSRDAEHIAAGWPSWLVKAAGEALSGWEPRRADTFEKLNKIGQGTYSSVYRARDLTYGKIVALKRVRFDNLDPESVTFMAREILILRRLDHPNIIKLEGLITSPTSCSLYLIFEYMEHDLTGLSSIPGIRFSEPQIKCYMKQLLSGLEHCHNNGVLHRDIKGSNLLIDDSGTLKIADFGLATFYDPKKSVPMTSRVITLWYRPPELLLGGQHYSDAVDLWSAGCILGELYSGRPVMTGRTEVEQLHKIFKLCGSPSEEFWTKLKLRHGAAFRYQQPYKSNLAERFKDISPSALALTETLLSVDPSCRGTATSALQSEFFTVEPLPCDPSCLPKYPPSKEIDARMREERHRRREAAELQARRADSGKQGGLQVDKANAGAKQMQESRAINQTEISNSKQDTPSSSSQTFDPPHRVAHSGPLTQGGGTMWSNAEKRPDDHLRMDQRGTRPSTSSRSSTSTRTWAQALDPRRHVGSSSLLNSNNSSSRRSSRFSGPIVGGTNNSRNDDHHQYDNDHTRSIIYSNQYGDRSFVGKPAFDGFKEHGIMSRGDKINYSGPLGVPAKNMDEVMRERDKRIQEAGRRSRLDKAKRLLISSR